MNSANMLRVVGVLVLVGGCGGEPANVAGMWSMNVTNGENGCSIDNWTVGDTTEAVPLTLTQADATVNGSVGGTVGVGANLVFGTNQLSGLASGRHVDLRLVGRAQSSGSCAYTPVLDLSADVNGDTMSGTITWSYDTNSSADCGYRATCETVQSMNAARPPTAS